MSRRPLDFRAAPLRGQMEAWTLDAFSRRIHRQHGDHKAAVLGRLEGTVVELGPGTGANMRYYPPGVHVIGIEPNPAMHPRLRAKADRLGVNLEIRTIRGEQLDADDASADAVIGTLVLCSVHDPQGVVAEIQRVLRPRGTYFFLEHVAAPRGTFTRRLQSWVKRPVRWMFNGCEVDRDTGALLGEAGFADFALTEIDTGPADAYVRHRIVGVATN